MSQFSKRYYSRKNKTIFLDLVWDAGYKNVQIYFKDNLLGTFPNPSVFINGVSLKHEELGKIKIKFTTVGPKKLEVKLNRKKLLTVNKLKLGYDFSGLIAVFATLSFFVLISIVILFLSYPDVLPISYILTPLLIEIFFFLLYGLCSYFLSKKKTWAYYVGTAAFTLTTLALISGLINMNSGLIFYLGLLIRFAILSYLILQFKNIREEEKRQSKVIPSDSILDR